MRVKILQETREYDGFFKIDKAVLQYEKFDGEMSQEITRLNFNRGDSAAVLLRATPVRIPTSGGERSSAAR